MQAATIERHRSYEFIVANRGKPGERSMRKLDDERLRVVTEEYEQKAHMIPDTETREIVERLGRVGREEINLRLAERDGEHS